TSLGEHRDGLETIAVDAALDQGVPVALRRECVCDLRGAPGEPCDAPAIVGTLGIPGLMRAVEGPDAEVGDPGHRRRALVGMLLARSWMIVSACCTVMRPLVTSPAREFASRRRDMSCRAGMERKARVSSMNP